MNSEHWKLDPAYQTQPAKPPTRATAGQDLDPERLNSAMAAWKELTAHKRICCDLEEVGEDSDDVHISKAGGTPLFSRAALDTWPICAECGDEMRLRYQLFLRDIPCFLCPKDADGLQLFFCFNNCGDEEASFEIRWIDSKSISDPIDESLGVPLPGKKLKARLKDDYPAVQELGDGSTTWLECGVTDLEIGDDEREFIDAWYDYHCRFSKAGGYVNWVQNGWSCCKTPLYLIVQADWAEGHQYVMACGECGKIHTEYQGS